MTNIIPTIETTGPLSTVEAAELISLEATIETGMGSFVAVGHALRTIRDRRLYRATHGTFSAYVNDRWNLGPSYAYRLMDSATIVDELSPIGDIPQTESQARALTRIRTPDGALDLPRIRKVWEDILQVWPPDQDGRRHLSADKVTLEVRRSVCHQIYRGRPAPNHLRPLALDELAEVETPTAESQTEPTERTAASDECTRAVALVQQAQTILDALLVFTPTPELKAALAKPMERMMQDWKMLWQRFRNH